MKATCAFLLLLLTLITISCDDDSGPNIAGQWNRTRTCGGFAGCIDSTPDWRIVLKIDALTFTESYNGTASLTGTYTLRSATRDDHSKTYEMKLSNGRTWSVVVDNDKLITTDNSIETGITSYYERIH